MKTPRVARCNRAGSAASAGICPRLRAARRRNDGAQSQTSAPAATATRRASQSGTDGATAASARNTQYFRSSRSLISASLRAASDGSRRGQRFVGGRSALDRLAHLCGLFWPEWAEHVPLVGMLRDDPFERAVDALGQRSRVGLTVACALWVQHLGEPQIVGHRELVVIEGAANGDRRAGEQRKLRHPARNE